MKPLTIDGTPLSYGAILRQVRSGVYNLDRWHRIMSPIIRDVVNVMIKNGHVPIKVAEAFDDLGNFCQKLGQDIMAERGRRRMPLPLGPDDRDPRDLRRRRPSFPSRQ